MLLIGTTGSAKIEGMKAERLLRQRFVLQDNALAELVVWRLPKPAHGSTHEYKYRLAFVVDDQCVLRFDNEAGKGDHYHEGDVERPYRFVSLDRLLEDFWRLVDDCNYD
jgi:hypothetical protein